MVEVLPVPGALGDVEAIPVAAVFRRLVLVP